MDLETAAVLIPGADLEADRGAALTGARAGVSAAPMASALVQAFPHKVTGMESRIFWGSVADLFPGSGAFLTPGSGAFLTPGSGMGKKSGSGSYFQELRNNFLH